MSGLAAESNHAPSCQDVLSRWALSNPGQPHRVWPLYRKLQEPVTPLYPMLECVILSNMAASSNKGEAEFVSPLHSVKQCFVLSGLVQSSR
jgi:hypothetical protein